MTVHLKVGDHVTMKVGTRGDDANEMTRTYPPGALGVVHDTSTDLLKLMVGPQDDSAILVEFRREDFELNCVLRAPLPDHLHAKIAPWSSIVGNGLLVTDDSGKIVGVLSLQGIASRAAAEALASRFAEAINFAEGERLARHAKTGGLYRVLGEAGGQDADKSSLASLEGVTVVIYRGQDGRMWFRRPGEFEEKFGETQGSSPRPEAQAGEGTDPQA